jgi:hypothetical protein
LRLIVGLPERLLALLYRYPAFVRDYLAVMFPAGDVPVWVVNALKDAGIEVSTTLTEDAPTARAVDVEE